MHSSPPLPRADASIQDSGIRRGRGRPGTTPSRYWGTAVELRGSPKLHVVFEGTEVGTPSACAVRGSSAVPGPILPPRASAFTGCRAGERRAPRHLVRDTSRGCGQSFTAGACARLEPAAPLPPDAVRVSATPFTGGRFYLRVSEAPSVTGCAGGSGAAGTGRVLTLHMRATGMLLNVLSMLAFTPGGGSNTKMRPARSRFTGTWGGRGACQPAPRTSSGRGAGRLPPLPAHLGVDLHGEEEPEAGVRLQGVQLLLQLHQPPRCQVHVLQHHPPAGRGGQSLGPARSPVPALGSRGSRTDGRGLPARLHGRVYRLICLVEAFCRAWSRELRVSAAGPGSVPTVTSAGRQPQGAVRHPYRWRSR